MLKINTDFAWIYCAKYVVFQSSSNEAMHYDNMVENTTRNYTAKLSTSDVYLNILSSMGYLIVC